MTTSNGPHTAPCSSRSNRGHSGDLARFQYARSEDGSGVVCVGTHHPLGFDAGDSNLYRYVRNNPTRSIDPTGLAAPCILASAIARAQQQAKIKSAFNQLASQDEQERTIALLKLSIADRNAVLRFLEARVKVKKVNEKTVNDLIAKLEGNFQERSKAAADLEMLGLGHFPPFRRPWT